MYRTTKASLQSDVTGGRTSDTRTKVEAPGGGHESKYSWTHSLPAAWLYGAIGDVHLPGLKTVMALLVDNASNADAAIGCEWKIIRVPSRAKRNPSSTAGGDDGISETLVRKAKDAVQKQCESARGLAWKGFKPPLLEWRGGTRLRWCKKSREWKLILTFPALTTPSASTAAAAVADTSDTADTVDAADDDAGGEQQTRQRRQLEVSWESARHLTSSCRCRPSPLPSDGVFLGDENSSRSVGYGIARDAWSWLTSTLHDTAVAVQRRVLSTMRRGNELGTLNMPRIGRDGGTSTGGVKRASSAALGTEIAIRQDLDVFAFFMELARWFPEMVVIRRYGSIEIVHLLLWWHVTDRIQQHLAERSTAAAPAAAASASTAPSATTATATTAATATAAATAAAAAARITNGTVLANPTAAASSRWPLETIGDARPLLAHQTKALDMLMQRHRRGLRAHFLADRAGAGKTRIAAEFLSWYIQEKEEKCPENVPKYVFYIGPPVALGAQAVPAEFALGKWPTHTWVPLKTSKRTEPKPYHINFLKHDHVRLCVDALLSHLAMGESLLFVDEAHQCMGMSQRASAVERASQTAAAVVLISATPAIHTDLMEAACFIRQMVLYPLTRKNIWTAARSMVQTAAPPPWTVHYRVCTASMTEEERTTFRNGMPPALGGVCVLANAASMRKAMRVVFEACTRTLIAKAPIGCVVWTANSDHQTTVTRGLRLRTLAAAVADTHAAPPSSSVYPSDTVDTEAEKLGETVNETTVVEVTKQQSVQLSPDNAKTVYPHCRWLVVPQSMDTSANYHRFHQQIRIEGPGNWSGEVQRLGRIGREGQRANELISITVVDELGFLERLRQKHLLPADVLAVLMQACLLS